MLIILDGNELNYKTTIANKLSEKLGIPIIKGSSFEIAIGTEEDMYQHFKSIATSKEPMIVDRYIWSNLVYAPLYPKYTLLSSEHANEIENDLNNLLNCYVVYLYTNSDILKERMLERGDDAIRADELEAINKKYIEVLSASNYKNFLMVNTGTMTSDKITQRILETIELMQNG